MSESAIQNVLEFLGVSQTDVERKMQRNRLLSEQLKPSGEFACGGNVYATGNGCYTMIGWLHNMLEHRGSRAFENMNPEGFERLAALNLPPEGSDRGLSEVVAFQNRNPIHRAHFELLVCAQKDVKDSILLVHPTCGPTQPGDIDGLVRIQTYEALKTETEKEYPMFRWAYLPYSMKMAGPREAIQHMIIRKNYGATHFIIGRDMAGTKSTIDGEDFYGAYDAQETGKKYSAELGVTVTHYENMVYVGPEEGYVQESVAKSKGYKVVKLSGTEFRRRLRAGEEIPEWFAFKSVVDILRKAGDSAFCA
ncbi:MET3 [Symbiodinium microadriaticum]|nr:MET3 [Symbiodinium sp. KB8]CAE7898825.1 MET3 [Symbiodinium microadriaticum]